MSLINSTMRFFRILTEIRWKYLLSGSFIRVSKGCSFICEKKSRIRHSRVHLVSGSLYVAESCDLNCVKIYVMDGSFYLGVSSILRGKPSLDIIIEHGLVQIKDHCRIECSRIWTRFNGELYIGQYTSINSGSEIRSDELVRIGDFCQLSYNVNIWDTNTHVIMAPNKREEITKEYFPYFGYEESKPDTQPVIVKSDCWIGKNATIMKGSILGENVIVGINTLLIGAIIEPNSTVVADVKLRVFPNRVIPYE